jgi:predicted nucleic acid-binding protein
MGLFVDTWGWLKLRDQRESGHEEVVSYFQDALQTGSVYATDYVLSETLTLLFKRLRYEDAWEGYQKIESARRTGFLEVKWIGRDRFEAALQLRQKYDDKPAISFIDLTSMAVMDEIGPRNVLTGDAHFRHVGMGFQRRP